MGEILQRERITSMSDEKKCPQCGATLPPETPEGLCPACLLRRGFETQTAGGAAAANVPPPTPESLASRFPQLEIVELVGRGGMGVVYKARHRGLDRWVALKILPAAAERDPAFGERFSREARALAKLDHPNIVTVFDSGEADGLFYFIMEYVDGVNLRQVLAAGEMKPEQALAIVPQICEALQYAHDQGVVHRDIKPENILVDKSGRVKIADFGLAKIVGQEARDFTLTGVGEVMGTPAYMAPEQVEHPSEVDHRADIYSLGVVFYQMLTGELPLGRFAPPSRKVRIDVRLDEVVLRTLEKEPGLRYQQAGEIKTEVETIAGTPTPVSNGHESFLVKSGWRAGFATYSPAAQEIRAHMNAQENREKTMRELIFSLWNVTTWFLPLFIALFWIPNFTGYLVAALALLVGLAGFPVLRKIQLEGLASTAWARERGFTADQLRKSSDASTPPPRLLIGSRLAYLVGLVVTLLAVEAAGLPRPIERWVNFLPCIIFGYLYAYGMRKRMSAKIEGRSSYWRLHITVGLLMLAIFWGTLAVYYQQHKKPSIAYQSEKGARSWIMSNNIINDIQPDGTIRMKSMLEKVNLTGETVTRDRVVSSCLFGNPPKVLDAQGHPMAVEVKRLKDYYAWWVTLNEPVRPGGIISWVFPEATVMGEIKKVSDFGLYEYSMKHWPAVGGFTHYVALYRLPAGAEVVEKYPAKMTQEVKEGRTELSFDQMIPAGGFVEIRFRYHLPTQSPAASQSKRQRFEPKAGMEEKANWSVEDKPSIFNPIGWASMIRLTLGGKASIRMPGDTEDTCRIKLIDGDDDKIRLNIEDVKKKNVLTLSLNRNQDAEILVNSQGYRVRYLATDVANDQPDTSPFANVLLVRLEPKIFGSMMERVIELANPAHRALNLVTGKFITPPDSHPLDFRIIGTTSLREAGADLFLQGGTSSPGILTSLDMQLCVRFQPPSGDAVNLETFTADELQALLGDSGGWHAQSAVNIPASDLNSALSIISGTDLYLFVTRDHVSGVLQIVEPSENPKGVKIRYKLVQNEATPVKPPQKSAEAEAELSPVERFQAALQQAVDSKNKEALLALFNREGIDAETKADFQDSILPLFDQMFSWPGVRVKCERRSDVQPESWKRNGKQYAYNGKLLLSAAFQNTDPMHKGQGPIFQAGLTPKGMRLLLPVAASQPAAQWAQNASELGSELLSVHGVAANAGPDTKDYPITMHDGQTETVHLEKSVLLDWLNVRSVKPEPNGNGDYSLRVTLDEEGTRKFAEITARRLEKRIGIVVDGRLLSAPRVKDPIFGGNFTVGNQSEQQARDLAAKLTKAIETGMPEPSATSTPSPSPVSSPSMPSQDMKNEAVAFVDLLAKGDFAKAHSEFDATMSAAMSEQMLATVWGQLESSGGKYQGHDAPRLEVFRGFTIVYVPSRWERARLDLKVVYDKAGKVTGLWVVPPGSSISGSSPEAK